MLLLRFKAYVNQVQACILRGQEGETWEGGQEEERRKGKAGVLSIGNSEFVPYE